MEITLYVCLQCMHRLDFFFEPKVHSARSAIIIYFYLYFYGYAAGNRETIFFCEPATQPNRYDDAKQKLQHQQINKHTPKTSIRSPCKCVICSSKVHNNFRLCMHAFTFRTIDFYDYDYYHDNCVCVCVCLVLVKLRSHIRSAHTFSGSHNACTAFSRYIWWIPNEKWHNIEATPSNQSNRRQRKGSERAENAFRTAWISGERALRARPPATAPKRVSHRSIIAAQWLNGIWLSAVIFALCFIARNFCYILTLIASAHSPRRSRNGWRPGKCGKCMCSDAWHRIGTHKNSHRAIHSGPESGECWE